MATSRRGFLAQVASAVAAVAVLPADPEKLLWVPGAKKYFDTHVPTPKLATDEEVRTLFEHRSAEFAKHIRDEKLREEQRWRATRAVAHAEWERGTLHRASVLRLDVVGDDGRIHTVRYTVDSDGREQRMGSSEHALELADRPPMRQATRPRRVHDIYTDRVAEWDNGRQGYVWKERKS